MYRVCPINDPTFHFAATCFAQGAAQDTLASDIRRVPVPTTSFDRASFSDALRADLTAVASGGSLLLSENDLTDALARMIVEDSARNDLMTWWNALQHPNLPEEWAERFTFGNPAELTGAELAFARIRLASNPSVREPLIDELFNAVPDHFHADLALSASTNPNCPTSRLIQWGQMLNPDRVHAYAMLNVLDHPRTPTETVRQCMITLMRYARGSVEVAYGQVDGRRQIMSRLCTIAVDCSDPRSGWMSEADRSYLIVASAIS